MAAHRCSPACSLLVEEIHQGLSHALMRGVGKQLRSVLMTQEYGYQAASLPRSWSNHKLQPFRHHSNETTSISHPSVTQKCEAGTQPLFYMFPRHPITIPSSSSGENSRSCRPVNFYARTFHIVWLLLTADRNPRFFPFSFLL
jgi:hypothetical protein